MTSDSGQNNKPSLTTHILNIQTGQPAAGVTVNVYKPDDPTAIASGVTDDDGRVTAWNCIFALDKSEYVIEFLVGEWFEKRGETTLYPKIQIEFSVADDRHYHIPLLLSAFGYSTYRGS